MPKLLHCCAVAAFVVALAASVPARAFVPSQAGIANAAADVSGIVTVKRPVTKQRPPGWSRGRKVGWQGRHAPPGQRRR